MRNANCEINVCPRFAKALLLIYYLPVSTYCLIPYNKYFQFTDPIRYTHMNIFFFCTLFPYVRTYVILLLWKNSALKKSQSYRLRVLCVGGEMCQEMDGEIDIERGDATRKV